MKFRVDGECPSVQEISYGFHLAGKRPTNAVFAVLLGSKTKPKTSRVGNRAGPAITVANARQGLSTSSAYSHQVQYSRYVCCYGYSLGTVLSYSDTIV